ncbi:hypothetical protein ATANTOWER_003207 [Ataeniobius toweri]|uniref:Uncharacterized protein n=1 Tax=Ataeniobius toweri TaxID=208326 RepID=A0ABU7A5Z8_9TELE|nr:hypothetical protein [Ataeniobius toweri]
MLAFVAQTVSANCVEFILSSQASAVERSIVSIITAIFVYLSSSEIRMRRSKERFDMILVLAQCDGASLNPHRDSPGHLNSVRLLKNWKNKFQCSSNHSLPDTLQNGGLVSFAGSLLFRKDPQVLNRFYVRQLKVTSSAQPTEGWLKTRFWTICRAFTAQAGRAVRGALQ